MNDRMYKLRQFHFHDPSEHPIDGKVYPMEMHLVHQDEGEHVLVVGILLEFGRENKEFSRIGDWLERYTGSRVPPTGGEVVTELSFNLTDVLPGNTHHYSYHGSLTTPPCSKGVQWIILRDPIVISEVQAGRFVSAFGPNAGPLQPLQNRNIGEN